MSYPRDIGEGFADSKYAGNQLAVNAEQQREDIRSLVALKETYPELKVLVALGGWGGCETCSDVFSVADGRREFAESARELLVEYDLDGLDLDWEYPAIEGYPGHAFKPEDKQNFTSLVRILRETFGDEYELSFAAGAGTRFMDNAVEWPEGMPHVDRVNLMTYDFGSGDGTITGHHTLLYSTPSKTDSKNFTVRSLIDLGVERNKIVIGAAFYARVWEAVEAEDGDALYRKARFKEFVAYRDQANYFSSDCTTQWDTRAQAPFCYSPTADIFGTFDNKRSVEAKTRYALENGLGGIMFWQLGQDTYEDGLLSSIAETRANETRAEVE